MVVMMQVGEVAPVAMVLSDQVAEVMDNPTLYRGWRWHSSKPIVELRGPSPLGEKCTVEARQTGITRLTATCKPTAERLFRRSITIKVVRRLKRQ